MVDPFMLNVELLMVGVCGLFGADDDRITDSIGPITTIYESRLIREGRAHVYADRDDRTRVVAHGPPAVIRSRPMGRRAAETSGAVRCPGSE